MNLIKPIIKFAMLNLMLGGVINPILQADIEYPNPIISFQDRPEEIDNFPFPLFYNQYQINERPEEIDNFPFPLSVGYNTEDLILSIVYSAISESITYQYSANAWFQDEHHSYNEPCHIYNANGIIKINGITYSIDQIVYFQDSKAFMVKTQQNHSSSVLAMFSPFYSQGKISYTIQYKYR